MRRPLHPILLTLSTLLAVSLHGCMVGPDYTKPDLVTNDSWHSSLVAGLEKDKDGPGLWWKEFNDPILDTLIERAQTNNLDLRTMMTRVEFARAEYGIEESFLLPSVGANGYAVWYRADQGISPVPGVFNPTGDAYELDLAFSWEIDVWGRVRRQAQAAQQNFYAQIENWRDFLITVRAGVADSYISYRTYRRTVELHELAVAAAELGLDLSTQAYENGALDLRVVLDNSSTLNTLQAAVYEWEARAQNELNQISVLLGETPGQIAELIGPGGKIPIPPSTIGVAVPAEVIRQRPDVRAAERMLASAVATLGVAEAELLPTFTLTGSLGYQSDGTTSLLTWANRAWNIGPSFSWSLLNWGRVQNQISAQKAVVQTELLGYESTVLKAYQEVENALVNFASSELSRRNIQRARDDSLESLMLSSSAYESGVEDVQSVIASELQFIQMEFELIEQESAVAMGAVSIYKSTGGDWSPVMPSADGPVPIKSKASQSVVDANSGGTS
ncbi:MAG: hypothetical protein CBC35_11905 [Planctomycetes bacterium TMED75]|nr:hypothetical protein [Planctomycetaceae bacterium]OUU90433.1 MAG: hypothetical protein CBC35_11905 [Planctomycetes bacterium TMED75]